MNKLALLFEIMIMFVCTIILNKIHFKIRRNFGATAWLSNVFSPKIQTNKNYLPHFLLGFPL